MNMNEAKKDFAARLKAAGIPFTKITGKTVSFSDLARATPIFLEVHGATFRMGMNELNDLTQSVPKPSEGGYCANYGNDCKWVSSDNSAKTRLEYLRKQIVNECISLNEIHELQSLKDHIEPGDVQLLEWAGVPEFPEDN